ncbi:sugar phosphate isomerase/epimerase family protein [Candidatus Entotheonella palauensis]|uniref:sugar phosphate isomerase/epimerase family protein n=1 Tax=Candidatus Entotheonella palauensis TaxID=93172 RepID=UPI000B7E149E|nr:sugar phosphate isomerase/epimerase [Candidatus Entotheonella palauensis]
MSTEITLGNASYGFREYSLPEFFEASKKIGLAAVEIDCGWLEDESRNKIAVNATTQEIAEVKRLAAEAGVNVTALGGGAVVGLNGDVAEDRCDELMMVIDLADALDARVIRVFTEHDFTHSKHYVLPAERVTDALYETLSAAFNKLGKYAQEKNVSLAIENHGGTSATGARLKRLLDMVPYESVGVTYDPANYAYGGEDPHAALLAIQDRVVYTHWKDVAHTANGVEYRAFGEGDIDWEPIMRTLLESYDGIWAIEYERKVDSTLETLMAGTRKSMANLQTVLEQVQGRGSI